MRGDVSQLELTAELWLRSLANASMEASLVIVFVFLVCWSLPRLNAEIKAWLWRLGLLKILLSFFWLSPVLLPVLPAPSPRAMMVDTVSSERQRPLPPPLVAAAGGAGAGLAGAAHGAAQREAVPLTLVGMGLWLTGVLLQGAFLLHQQRQLRRFRRSLSPCGNARARRAVIALTSLFRLRREPRLATAEGISSPQLVGILQATIVLPKDLLKALAPRDLRLVLTHEVAHIKRRDLAWGWLLTGVRVLLFFHPLIWLAQREWRACQEMACDELVVQKTPRATSRYSHILLTLAAKAQPLGSGGLGLTERAGSGFLALKRRLEALYSHRLLPWTWSRYLALSAAIALLVMSFPWHVTARASVEGRHLLSPNGFGFTQLGDGKAAGTGGPAWQATGAAGDGKAAGTGGPAWQATGDGYAFAADATQSRRGAASGRIDARIPGTYGTLSRCIAAATLRGGRLTYRAELKTKAVTGLQHLGGAGLWLRVDDGQNQVVGSANMDGTVVSGDTDWHAYQTEVVVDQAAERVCFGVFLRGRGTLWVNQVSLALQAEAPLAADRALAAEDEQARNLDFEDAQGQRPSFWLPASTSDYAVSLDDQEKVSGERSLLIAHVPGQPTNGHGRVMQCIKAGAWRGQRLRYGGYLRTQDVDAGRAGLWMLVEGADTRRLSFDNMHDREIVGTTPWRRYEVLLDIAPEATRVCFGILLSGTGRVWADALELSPMEKTGVSTGRVPLIAPTNLNFESGESANGRPRRWYGGNEDYVFSVDRQIVHAGAASAQVRSVGRGLSAASDFGKLYQCVEAAAYRGRVVHFSGFLRSQSRGGGWAGLWLKVQDGTGGTLAFNHGDEAIAAPEGPGRWRQRQTSVLVPANAAQICYGFHLAGEGRLWVDDLQLVADPALSSTGT